MRVKTLLILTALVSSVLGAIVAYLILTVPNDVQAGSLLKQARNDIKQKKNDSARESLARIIQQYPRTDAAAAATVALTQLQNEERLALERRVNELTRTREAQDKRLAQIQQSVTKIENTPPAPVIVQQPAPAKKPTTTKKPTVKKKTPVKKTRR